MSILAKIGIPAIVIIGLIGGTWFMKHDSSKMPEKDAANQTAQTGTLQKNDVPVVQTSSEVGAITSRDSSNTSLDADMSSIDAQLKTVDSNSAAVDQKDAPVAQDSL